MLQISWIKNVANGVWAHATNQLAAIETDPPPNLGKWQVPQAVTANSNILAVELFRKIVLA